MPTEMIVPIAGFVIATLLTVCGALIVILLNMILREITSLKAQDATLHAQIEELRGTSITRAEHRQSVTDVRDLIAALRAEVQDLIRQLLTRGVP